MALQTTNIRWAPHYFPHVATPHSFAYKHTLRNWEPIINHPKAQPCPLGIFGVKRTIESYEGLSELLMILLSELMIFDPPPSYMFPYELRFEALL